MLRALGWDHPRCMSPMRACAERWREMTGVEIDWEARSLEAFGDQPLEEAAARLRPDRDRPPVLRARRRHPLPDAARRAARPLGAGRAAGRRGRPQPRLVRLRRPPVGAGDRRRLPGDGGARRAARRRSRCRRPGAPCSSWPAAGQGRSRCRSPLPTPSPAGSASPRRTVRSRSPTGRVSETATATLAELARLGPAEALGWEPPDILGRHDDNGRDRLRAADLRLQHLLVARPSGPAGSPTCRRSTASPAAPCSAGPAWRSPRRHLQPGPAAEFAAWASGGEAQREIVARTGGQPGHRSAWDDPELDRISGGFYSGTRASIDGAWVRPREEWWPVFQLDAGRLLTENLLAGDVRSLTDRLRELHRRHSA